LPCCAAVCYTCWRYENDSWQLKDIPFTEEWDNELKEEIVATDFTNCLKSGGFIWGIFNSSNDLIAFAALLPHLFGSKNQYLQLMQLHVSYEYRSCGLGKQLFEICTQKATQLGAKKLYVSAHSAEESCGFYEKVGCVDAVEICKQIAEHEPYGRQMEYVLCKM